MFSLRHSRDNNSELEDFLINYYRLLYSNGPIILDINIISLLYKSQRMVDVSYLLAVLQCRSFHLQFAR